MNKIDILYNEYPGDAAWEKFSQCFPSTVGTVRMGLILDFDVLKILVHKFGGLNEVCHWLDKSIPALDFKSPRDILISDKRGLTIIRSLIMRMP